MWRLLYEMPRRRLRSHAQAAVRHLKVLQRYQIDHRPPASTLSQLTSFAGRWSSGVARNMKWGGGSKAFPPLFFPILPSLPFFPFPPVSSSPVPSPALPFSPPSSAFHPLRSRIPKSQLWTPQFSLRWNLSQNQIWCIRALKYEIWWQQFIILPESLIVISKF